MFLFSILIITCHLLQHAIKQKGKLFVLNYSYFTFSNKKLKNCLCLVKPVKIVSASNIVDIDDPEMLEKIDEKEKDNIKSCLCESPNPINICNFCLTNSKEKEKERRNNFFYNRFVYDINSQKKNFESKIKCFNNKFIILAFPEYTPNKTDNYYNSSTPAYYFRYSHFSDHSEKKMNFAK